MWVNPVNVKYYLRKYGLKNFILTDLNSKFDYAMLINRAILDDKVKIILLAIQNLIKKLF